MAPQHPRSAFRSNAELASLVPRLVLSSRSGHVGRKTRLRIFLPVPRSSPAATLDRAPPKRSSPVRNQAFSSRTLLTSPSREVTEELADILDQ